MRILLHTCCAPCSGAIVEKLLEEGTPPVIYYCNPNIYPREEYDIRKNECVRFAGEMGLEIVEDTYDHEQWLRCVSGLENEPERGNRCLECFKMRLLRAARYALANGFDTLTTTLASSRWKNLEQIDKAGNWAVETALKEAAGQKPDEASQEAGTQETNNEPAPLVWLGRNWRKGGLQERRGQIIRERGFYNQLYCGCEFSNKQN